MLKQSGIHPGEFITQLKDMGFAVKFVDEKAEHIYEKMIDERYYLTDIIAIKSST
jgi:hypothetical protein